MAETLANIETDVQFYANDRRLTITSGDHLRIANLIYQGFLTPDFRMPGTNIKIGRRWPEVTQEDTSITTTVGTEQYTWPSSPQFKEPFYIELVDATDSLPTPIYPVTSLDEWSELDDTNNGTPKFYMLIDVAGTVMLALRPNPDTLGDTIRITGAIEGLEFASPSTTTVDADSASAQKVLNVAATTMFSAEDHFIVGEGTTREETGVVASVTAGASITAVSDLAFSHTAAQADVVAKTTKFLNKNSDRALAMLIASQFKRVRGDPSRANELVGEAMSLLPADDYQPTTRPTNQIRPWAT
jgi:hypothetical protein